MSVNQYKCITFCCFYDRKVEFESLSTLLIILGVYSTVPIQSRYFFVLSIITDVHSLYSCPVQTPKEHYCPVHQIIEQSYTLGNALFGRPVSRTICFACTSLVLTNGKGISKLHMSVLVSLLLSLLPQNCSYPLNRLMLCYC